MNLSLAEAGGEVLAVSQFTLAASVRKGRRPSFDGAEEPGRAAELFDHFVGAVEALGVTVETGVFQAMMDVHIVNDGPVTFILDSRPGRRRPGTRGETGQVFSPLEGRERARKSPPDSPDRTMPEDPKHAKMVMDSRVRTGLSARQEVMPMSRFVARKKVESLPRVPLRGTLDLTYRCANDCRHCWLRLAPDAPERAAELSLDEIRRVVDEARALGCREWAVSGGEPMLRADFGEIFSLITARSSWYTLNTNGTLITPGHRPPPEAEGHEACRALRRHRRRPRRRHPPSRLVRSPGAGDRLSPRGGRGFHGPGRAHEDEHRRLRRDGPPGRVLEPQLEDRRDLALPLGLRRSRPEPRYPGRAARPGAASSSSTRPTPPARAIRAKIAARRALPLGRAAGLYATCVAGRRDFHVDPYGGMSFCSFVKDAALRLDLRSMTFAEAWDERLPRLAEAVVPSSAYTGACGVVRPAAGLQVVPRLRLSRAPRPFGQDRRSLRHRPRDAPGPARNGSRATAAASGSPASPSMSKPTCRSRTGPSIPSSTLFRSAVDGPADVVLRHHFSLPDLDAFDLGREVFRQAPWAVYRKDASWIYLMISPDPSDATIHRVMVFDDGHTRGRIYSPSDASFRAGGLDSLALLPSDQLVLARALPGFGGVFVHAAGGGHGRAWSCFRRTVGGRQIDHRQAHRRPGPCPLRRPVIVRKGPGGFRVHGTWNHGEIGRVSPGSAPLRGRLLPAPGRGQPARPHRRSQGRPGRSPAPARSAARFGRLVGTGPGPGRGDRPRRPVLRSLLRQERGDRRRARGISGGGGMTMPARSYVRKVPSGGAGLWSSGRSGPRPPRHRADRAVQQRLPSLLDQPPGRGRRGPRPGNGPPSAGRALLDEAAGLGCLVVRLTGGEPLLRDDFEEIYLHARQLGMRVMLFTNATLMTPAPGPASQGRAAARSGRSLGLRHDEGDLRGRDPRPGIVRGLRRGLGLLCERRRALHRQGRRPAADAATRSTAFEAWAAGSPGAGRRAVARRALRPALAARTRGRARSSPPCRIGRRRIRGASPGVAARRPSTNGAISAAAPAGPAATGSSPACRRAPRPRSTRTAVFSTASACAIRTPSTTSPRARSARP